MNRILIPCLVLSLFFSGCIKQSPIKTLVLFDSSVPGSAACREYLLPYLDHFGIEYEVRDLGTEKSSPAPGDYALLIVGQDFEDTQSVFSVFENFRDTDAGMLSFDPDLFSRSASDPVRNTKATWISCRNDHFITRLHDESDTIRCFSPMIMKSNPEVKGQIIQKMTEIPAFKGETKLQIVNY